MILQGYPDYTESGFDVNSPIPKLGCINMVIHNKTKKTDYPKHTSPLTIKFTLKGEEQFLTDDRNFRVNESSYLILNQGQTYSCNIDTENETESISVFFEPRFAEDALNSLILPSDVLLDNEIPDSGQSVQFLEKLYPHDNLLTPSIMKFRIASNYSVNDEEWMKNEFYKLLKNMLIVHRKINKQIEELPPIKKSTKFEVYKRLNIAKDFIDSNFCKPINVEMISKEARMSPFHFLRSFKATYKETPHQYVTKKRLEKASNMLMNSNMSVTNVCFEVGFKSPGSFSWLFKQKYGLYPQEIRRYYQYFLTKLAILKK